MTTKGTGRPEGGYRDAQGAPVPSVTEILGRYKNSTALIHWAAREGRSGMKYKKDEASGVGNAVHDAAEITIHHGEQAGRIILERLLDEDEIAQADRAYERWLEWFRKNSDVRWIETEVPYISERFNFAGTMDALAKTQRGLWIYDWKTSKTIGFDYVLQMGAYGILIADYFGIFPDGATIVRADKSEKPYNGGIEELSLNQTERRWASKCFLRLRRALSDEELFLEHLGRTH